MGMEPFNAGRSPIDGALIRAAASGAQDGWDAIVDRYAGVVWAVARHRRLSESEAASVSQLTWLRLRDRLGTMSSEEIGRWLEQAAERESVRVVHLSCNHAEGRARPA
jgi:hypothetical protein